MVTLRPAGADDAEAVLAVHRAAIRGVEAGYDERQRRAWLAVQDDPDQYPLEDPDQYLVVAEADGEVVGFAGLDRETGVLETLYVRPDAAGEGVGSALLADAEAEARAAGRDRVVMAASRNSVPFYRRHGYERADETFELTFGGVTLAFPRLEKALD